MSHLTECRSLGFADLTPVTLSTSHNIIIVHAVPFIRLGLASTIADASSLTSYSISAFTTLVEADAKVSEAKSGDVIILDINAWFTLTGPSNSDKLQRIKARGSSLGVIAPIKQVNLSRLETYDLLGLIDLDAELHDVIAMVEDLAACRRHVIKEGIQTGKAPRLSRLSRRQVDVLELMTHGLSNKQIASEIGVTEGNIKYHVTKIFKKLGCNLRAQAVKVFIETSGYSNETLGN
jgi:DNA-binding NarL/FixJ family response regulator